MEYVETFLLDHPSLSLSLSALRDAFIFHGLINQGYEGRYLEDERYAVNNFLLFITSHRIRIGIRGRVTFSIPV